jgi:hypothetical protein
MENILHPVKTQFDTDEQLKYAYDICIKRLDEEIAEYIKHRGEVTSWVINRIIKQKIITAATYSFKLAWIKIQDTQKLLGLNI